MAARISALPNALKVREIFFDLEMPGDAILLSPLPEAAASYPWRRFADAGCCAVVATPGKMLEYISLNSFIMANISRFRQRAVQIACGFLPDLRQFRPSRYRQQRLSV
ncbi:hypothetical protein [Collimonas sp. PA-H2]|uniref:hypothetical protein n=1 Tax=Collimonas sp. PA-H2 TaxID=1881062 RepID=UPI00130471A9|nr:hypothetical protein [Collimonas sp. PA-H2]